MVFKLISESSRIVVIAAVLAAWICCSALQGAEFQVDRDAVRLVRFISDAPIEDFDGNTELIDGYVRWSGDSLFESASPLEASELYFEVQLNGLDTGIGLRNRHMRENYLETDKFPYAYFKGNLASVRGDSVGSFQVVAEGVFGVHGSEKPKTIAVVVTPAIGGFSVHSELEVKLSDYDIEIPKLMFLKINELIKLEVSFELRGVEAQEKEEQ
jgi:polyisoprenoid-binding protein YceI